MYLRAGETWPHAIHNYLPAVHHLTAVTAPPTANAQHGTIFLICCSPIPFPAGFRNEENVANDDLAKM